MSVTLNNQDYNAAKTELEVARSTVCTCDRVTLDKYKECVCERSKRIREAKNKMDGLIAPLVKTQQ